MTQKLTIIGQTTDWLIDWLIDWWLLDATSANYGNDVELIPNCKGIKWLFVLNKIDHEKTKSSIEVSKEVFFFEVA